MTITGKTILITGASSGIGAATARRLAHDGHQLHLGARRSDRLSALAEELASASGAVSVGLLDVTDQHSVRTFVEDAQARYGAIDVLVNNAGLMPLSPVAELRTGEWEQMIDVNLRGILHGIAAVLPSMTARTTGHIINIASTAGLRVDPTAAVYSATKYAVRALSEGLRQEHDTIRVTTITPGFTESELLHQGGAPDARAAAQAAAEILALPASAVANAIAFAIDQPDQIDINEIVLRSTRQR